MLRILQVTTLFLTSIAWAQALAHVLEWPGKRRLGRDAYLTVQSIYYPGFTIGGLGEGLSMVAMLVLLIVTRGSGAAFRWMLVAFVALLAMHATYWVVTHPINKFWVKDQEMRAAGAGFFAIGTRGRDVAAQADTGEVWQRLRDRWEVSHAIRAGFAAIALIALGFALTA
jgi:hypothetical protein